MKLYCEACKNEMINLKARIPHICGKVNKINTIDKGTAVKVVDPKHQYFNRTGAIKRMGSNAFPEWAYVQLTLTNRERTPKLVFIETEKLETIKTQ